MPIGCLGLIGVLGVIFIIAEPPWDAHRFDDALLTTAVVVGGTVLCLLATLLYLSWRSGVTLHRRKRLARLWTGPLFPVRSKLRSLGPYSTVQLVQAKNGLYQIWLRSPLGTEPDWNLPSDPEPGEASSIAAATEFPSPFSSDHRMCIMKGSNYGPMRKQAEEVASYLRLGLEEIGPDHERKRTRRPETLHLPLRERLLRDGRPKMPPDLPSGKARSTVRPDRAAIEFPTPRLDRKRLFNVLIGLAIGGVIAGFMYTPWVAVGVLVLAGLVFGARWLTSGPRGGTTKLVVTPETFQLTLDHPLPLRSKSWEFPVDELEDVEVRTADETTTSQRQDPLLGDASPRLVVRTDSEAVEFGGALELTELEWLRDCIRYVVAGPR